MGKKHTQSQGRGREPGRDYNRDYIREPGREYSRGYSSEPGRDDGRVSRQPPSVRKPQLKKGSRLSTWLMILTPMVLVVLVGGYFLGLASPTAGMSPTMTPTPMGSSGSTGGAKTQNVSLPNYVKGANMTAAYQFAVDRPDVLDYVPCFCGCGQHSGHKSNKNCFVKDAQAGQTNGQVAFDDHGANCDMCIELANDAQRMTAEGKSLKEIRQYVESKYGGKGPSTNTPWPQA